MSAETTVTVGEIQFEHHRNGFGIGTARPRLSWISQTAAADWQQAGYEIARNGPDGALAEQTGRVDSESVGAA